MKETFTTQLKFNLQTINARTSSALKAKVLERGRDSAVQAAPKVTQFPPVFNYLPFCIGKSHLNWPQPSTFASV